MNDTGAAHRYAFLGYDDTPASSHIGVVDDETIVHGFPELLSVLTELTSQLIRCIVRSPSDGTYQRCTEDRLEHIRCTTQAEQVRHPELRYWIRWARSHTQYLLFQPLRTQVIVNDFRPAVMRLDSGLLIEQLRAVDVHVLPFAPVNDRHNVAILKHNRRTSMNIVHDGSR